MRVGISSIRTKDTKINRHELVTSLQRLGHSVTIIGVHSDGELHPDYAKYNTGFLSIPLKRNNTNPFTEIKAIREIRKKLLESNIELLLVYGIRTFPAMTIGARLAGVKKVLCIVNGSGRLFQLRGALGVFVKCISYPMLWLAFLLSDRIFFQNEDDMRMIKRKGLLWRTNYQTIPGSGVNLNEFKFCKLPKRPVFSMICRITGSKGVDEYIRAARYVKEKYPDAEFNLIGPFDNDDSSIDIEKLRNAKKDGIITLIGYVNDVRPYIEQCRIFVLPSYYPEGIPRSILEAMAMGRAIITTNSPGCRETVIDGYNGYLIPPKNADELAKTMVWMIENADAVEQMGVNSRRMCEERFDVIKVNETMLKHVN